jgi:hypothetical protein
VIVEDSVLNRLSDPALDAIRRTRGWTSMRLLGTGDPEASLESCVRILTGLVEKKDAEVLASNQVIGEA